MGVCASFFSRQDERCSSAFASSGLHFGLSPGRLPLGHWQCLQQLLWRGLETTTTTGSTTKASAAKVPAATVPATASATVPAAAAVPAAPAAVPTTAAAVPAQGQRFQQQQQQPAAPSFNPRPTAAPAAPPRLVGGTSLCGAAAPNHFWTDPRDNIQRGYVATWKIGCSTFQQHEAKAYCESMGMEPVSLDTPAKQDNSSSNSLSNSSSTRSSSNSPSSSSSPRVKGSSSSSSNQLPPHLTQ